MDLPLDVLAQIIARASHGARDVARYARVCRDWRDAAYEDVVWDKMWHHHFPQYDSISAFHALATGYRRIFYLVYTSWQYELRPSWRAISVGEDLSIVHMRRPGEPRSVIHLSPAHRDTGAVVIADYGDPRRRLRADASPAVFQVSTDQIVSLPADQVLPAVYDARMLSRASDVLHRNGFRVFFHTNPVFTSPADSIEIHHERSTLALHIDVSANAFWVNRLDTGQRIACFEADALDLLNPPAEAPPGCCESLLVWLGLRKRYRAYAPLLPSAAS